MTRLRGLKSSHKRAPQWPEHRCHVYLINRIQAVAPNAEPPFWGLFLKGTYLPQNRERSCPTQTPGPTQKGLKQQKENLKVKLSTITLGGTVHHQSFVWGIMKTKRGGNFEFTLLFFINKTKIIQVLLHEQVLTQKNLGTTVVLVT